MGTLMVVAAMALCLLWTGGCVNGQAPDSPPPTAQTEVQKRHAAELARLFEDLQLELSGDNQANVDRYHVAKARLRDTVQEDDIPLLGAKMVDGDYRDLSKDVRGVGGWQPEVYVSKKEKARLDRKRQLGFVLGEILCDYYARTNSPKARDVFLGILRERDEYRFCHVSRFVGVDPRTHGDVFRPELKKTDWIETVHREYRTFERLEASLEAAKQLYFEGTYKDEAVWFFFTVLKDDRMECSQNGVEMVIYLNGYQWTQRELAINLAFDQLKECINNVDPVDTATFGQYMVPWAKYIRKHGTSKTQWQGRSILDPLQVSGAITKVDTDSIPEGTPVPPRPATVIDLPQEKQMKAE